MLQGCCSYVPGLQAVMKDFEEPEYCIVAYLSVISRILLINQTNNSNELMQCATIITQQLIQQG